MRHRALFKRPRGLGASIIYFTISSYHSLIKRYAIPYSINTQLTYQPITIGNRGKVRDINNTSLKNLNMFSCLVLIVLLLGTISYKTQPSRNI